MKQIRALHKRERQMGIGAAKAIFVAGTVLAASGAAFGQQEGNPMSLPGTWTCVSGLIDGKPLAEETVKQLKLTMTADRFKTQRGDQVQLAPKEFDSLATPLLHTNSTVGVRVGSIAMFMQTCNIVSQIKKGFYEDFLPPEKRQR